MNRTDSPGDWNSLVQKFADENSQKSLRFTQKKQLHVRTGRFSRKDILAKLKGPLRNKKPLKQARESASEHIKKVLTKEYGLNAANQLMAHITATEKVTRADLHKINKVIKETRDPVSGLAYPSTSQLVKKIDWVDLGKHLSQMGFDELIDLSGEDDDNSLKNAIARAFLDCPREEWEDENNNLAFIARTILEFELEPTVREKFADSQALDSVLAAVKAAIKTEIENKKEPVAAPKDIYDGVVSMLNKGKAASAFAEKAVRQEISEQRELRKSEKEKLEFVSKYIEFTCKGIDLKSDESKNDFLRNAEAFETGFYPGIEIIRHSWREWATKKLTTIVNNNNDRVTEELIKEEFFCEGDSEDNLKALASEFPQEFCKYLYLAHSTIDRLTNDPQKEGRLLCLKGSAVTDQELKAGVDELHFSANVALLCVSGFGGFLSDSGLLNHLDLRSLANFTKEVNNWANEACKPEGVLDRLSRYIKERGQNLIANNG